MPQTTPQTTPQTQTQTQTLTADRRTDGRTAGEAAPVTGILRTSSMLWLCDHHLRPEIGVVFALKLFTFGVERKAPLSLRF